MPGFKRINGLKEDYFQIDLVGLTSQSVEYGGHFQVKPTKSISDIETTNVIIVTAISGDLEKGIEQNKEFITWIQEQRIKNDADIASLCKGARR